MERRQHRRIRLRLGISRLEGPFDFKPAQRLWTSNVSAGGMYFHVPKDSPVERGASTSFELIVPPGEGYALTAGKVKGAGTIVRTDPAGPDAIGVALRFTQPLVVEF